jgi:hypothetical protein
MAPALSPEFKLMAACAMWPPSDHRTEAIRAAAAEPLDWPRFLRVADRHQVVGLVSDGLMHARPDVPPEVVRKIGARAAMLVRQNLEMARESLRIQRLFDDAHIPVLFLKGAALAVLAFGNLGLRSGQDIDLLVTSEALPAATAVIRRAGYRRFDPPAGISDGQLRLVMPLRKDLGFVHETTGLRIELHWRLFLNPHAIVEASGRRVVPLAGVGGLRTLGEEDLFAYLCMHGALHWWNRLKWLADINALLVAASNDSAERLLRAAEIRGAGRAAAQALLLCHRLLGAAVPAQLIAMLARSTAVRWLEATALHAMTTGQGEHDPHDVRFGTTRGSLSTVLLSRSWRYRLTELNFHLTNQADILAVPLPERLRFLYPFLRFPIWGWRQFAKRRVR